MDKWRSIAVDMCPTITPGRYTRSIRVGLAALLFLGARLSVSGQSALDGFDPKANGSIEALAVQPNGKIVVAGTFTTLSPNGGTTVLRNRIARLNPDGTLDIAFNPNADWFVNAIALQTDGKIIVGGQFTSIGGLPRNHIARLDPTTGLADSFNPNADGDVWSIAVEADGRILVGGQFSAVGGENRNRIARLDSITGAADSFDANANDSIYAIVVQRDGKILVGGTFTGSNSIGGQTRNYVARLDPTTGLADSFDPNADNPVFSLGLAADGKVLAGGAFTNVGGLLRNRIARLDGNTGLADSFDPDSNDTVVTIAVQSDGKILVGGSFSGANSIGGQPRNHIARLDPITGLADAFDPNANDTVWSIATQADDKVVAGGSFNGGDGIVGQARNYIARLEKDGSLDQTLNLNLVGTEVYTTAVQPDGKFLIGGSFSNVLGVPRSNMARFNPDGTLDLTFSPNPNNGVGLIVVQTDGRILVGGGFTNIGGQPRNRIARLDGVTGAADTFDPNASSYVYSIVAQPDGNLLVSGLFHGANSIGGAARNYIARVNPLTGLADSFDPNANDRVRIMALQPDGKILVGGDFTAIGGQPRRFMGRLDAITGLADSFDPNPQGDPWSIIMQADGKILVAGNFITISGQMRTFMGRLDATTGLLDSFNPNSPNRVSVVGAQADGKVLVGGAFPRIGGQARWHVARLYGETGGADSMDPNLDINALVYSINTHSDGKILLGGKFATIGGQTRNSFARLSNDTASLRYLDVTQTVVRWICGGSSPQFSRVTFDYTLDNENYVPLGSGVFDGTGWKLSGLNLPTEKNVWIRARGFYRSGLYGSSESITESIQNAFVERGSVATPTATPSATPILTPTPTASPTPTLEPSPGSTSTPVPSSTPSPSPTLTPPLVCANTWTSVEAANAPRARIAHSAIWTGSEMIIWGGSDGSINLNTGGRYDPVVKTWATTTTVGAPSARSGHTAVWSGSKMIVWGGDGPNPGGRYDPGTDSWVATTIINAPSPRAAHVAVWTGSEMLIWGGINGTTYLNTGGRYNPETDTWTPISTNNAPSSRSSHTAVWDGNEMIVWGGVDGSGTLNTGGRYDPSTDTWTSTSTSGVGLGRRGHTAVWTGTEMIVWGGWGMSGATGIRYDPFVDSWTAVTTINAPSLRDRHSAVWTSSEMIIWGGNSSNGIFNTGARYNPAFDSWTATSSLNVARRFSHTAVWTGSEMIVWGGIGSDDPTPTPSPGGAIGAYSNTGGRYCVGPPATPAPTPTPTPTPSPNTLVSVSGSISYCAASSSVPVQNAMLALTGDATVSAVTDNSGAYQFLSLWPNGTYTVIPNKNSLVPGSIGITTIDVAAIQRHLLQISFLSECRLEAADVNSDSAVNTIDVIAVQRFFLGFSTGIANVGKYRFIPQSRSYIGIVSDQSNQLYDAMIFGDVAAPFSDGP